MVRKLPHAAGGVLPVIPPTNPSTSVATNTASPVVRQAPVFSSSARPNVALSLLVQVGRQGSGGWPVRTAFASHTS